ncbi:MAG TPA: AAA family ATPase [Thermoanaerobaculia bacterium]|nr:AAA family ATPase [Thermoanaerobaculia bacterium]
MPSHDLYRTESRADVSPDTGTRPEPPQILTKTRSERRERVQPSCSSAATRHIDRVLRRRVIGQDEAIDALLSSFARLFSGLRDPARPVLTALLLGPTGVGKTETARALAMALFGSEDALTRIHCEEYAHGHEMAKLLGAPPGYVGYQIEPLLSQARIDAAHRQALADGRGLVSADRRLFESTLNSVPERMLSIVLFDEIEKAHPMVWNALLGILEDGLLTLGNNQTVDFTRTILLLTSNVGGQEMSALLDPNRLGFRAEVPGGAHSRTSLAETAMAAARRTFPAEFMNRFDEVRVYSPLARTALERILDRFLTDLHERTLAAGVPLVMRLSPQARTLVLERGTDPRYGARPLRRAIEHELVDPISRLVVAERLRPGDLVEIDVENDALAFYRVPGERERVTGVTSVSTIR